MDPSKALDFFADRRDLLAGFLFEYTLLLDENPELAEVLSFEAYVQYSFSYYAAGAQHGAQEQVLQELRRLREHLPLPCPPAASLDYDY